MPLFIGVFLCFPSRAGVYACERARERPFSRARFARLLAPARCSPISRLIPYQTRSRWSRAWYGIRLLRGRALPPLVIGSRPPFGRLPLLSAARSLRSLACSGKGLPFSSRSVVVDALPMVARLPPHSASFRSPPAFACNRLSAAFRPPPLIVCCALAPLACFRLRGQVALPLRSLNQLPSLLAPLPVGFCSRPSRFGGSTGLACRAPRLVSAIPPHVSQSVAEGCGGLGG